ncbi:MAG: hypothetical protein JJT85_05825 [Chromatiales bacterium]|nr:hypothetical protein [Chromatiales bacterium]
MTELLRLPLAASLLLLGGCTTPGFIYTDVTVPLTVDMQETPRATTQGRGSQVTIREPITRIGVRAEWDGFAIGRAARETGIDVVYYADLRRQSVLGGLWGRTTVVVYGVRELGPDPETPPGSVLPPR